MNIINKWLGISKHKEDSKNMNENNTVLVLTSETTQKQLKQILKDRMPRKAKSVLAIIEGKPAKLMDAKQADTLYEVQGSIQFGATPLKKLKGVEEFAALPLRAEKGGKEAPMDKIARVGTGFIKMIDDLLVSGEHTVITASEEVLKAFPDKDPHSVRRIISNRPNTRKRRGLPEAKWLPCAQGTGFMHRIDALYAEGGHTFKEIIAILMKEFTGKQEESVIKIARNRARVLRLAGKKVDYIKAVSPIGKPKAKAKKTKKPIVAVKRVRKVKG